MTDLITDMFNRIRNAQAVSKERVVIPFSNLRLKIAELLQEEGFIEDIKKRKQKGKKVMEVILKYNEEEKPAITEIKKVSKPGQRIYVKNEEIKITKGGYGLTIISTSQGIISGKEAKKRKIGGEVIAKIW